MGYPSSWPAGPAYGASYGGQGEGTPPPNYDDAWLAHDISQILQSYAQRSEEHTSELQSLMRISYAVFCLKKKNSNKNCININSNRLDIHLNVACYLVHNTISVNT